MTAFLHFSHGLQKMTHFLAFLDGVVSVAKNLRLDNGHKAVGLADGGVPEECLKHGKKNI
jgi:hypothetical protein